MQGYPTCLSSHSDKQPTTSADARLLGLRSEPGLLQQRECIRSRTIEGTSGRVYPRLAVGVLLCQGYRPGPNGGRSVLGDPQSQHGQGQMPLPSTRRQVPEAHSQTKREVENDKGDREAHLASFSPRVCHRARIPVRLYRLIY
jgi:hypothetical protein